MANVEAIESTPQTAIDSDFLNNLAQNLVSIRGAFAMVILIMQRDRTLQDTTVARHLKIFYWLLVISIATAILSSTVKVIDDATSTILGYLSSATQLVATFLIVKGSIDKMIMHNEAV